MHTYFRKVTDCELLSIDSYPRVHLCLKAREIVWVQREVVSYQASNMAATAGQITDKYKCLNGQT